MLPTQQEGPKHRKPYFTLNKKPETQQGMIYASTTAETQEDMHYTCVLSQPSSANRNLCHIPCERKREVQPYERVQRRQYLAEQRELQEEKLAVAQACATHAACK